MDEQKYFHAVHAIIEQIYLRGVPRVVVNATAPDVVVPEYLRKLHGEELALDLDPNYPMELEYTKEGLHATLSFHPTVTRCFLPWRSIWMIYVRGTPEAVLVPSHAPPAKLAAFMGSAQNPPSLRDTSESTSAKVNVSDELKKAQKHSFRVIQGGKKTPDLRAVPPLPPNGHPPKKAG